MYYCCDRCDLVEIAKGIRLPVRLVPVLSVIRGITYPFIIIFLSTSWWLNNRRLWFRTDYMLGNWDAMVLVYDFNSVNDWHFYTAADRKSLLPEGSNVLH
ncbi:hypothetical protein M5W68_17395 [Paenibacillus larvae]|uniref:hypothetical protein n=1 Tax=Paenibacillus larvae TaxID=1464 RepID=UPI002282A669|nr:hypothetical protein [Paenibacillus larvae]MCY9526837.1 hypothetical protein [Paenibacillus larvae]